MSNHGKPTAASSSGTRNARRESVPRVYIVEDHPVVRSFLSQLVQGEMGFVVSGMSADARHALAEVGEQAPELVILDLSLAGGHGFELIKDLGALPHAPRILVFSTHEEDLYAERVLEAGALGYVRKTASPEQLAEAIRRVLSGQVYLSPEMTSKVLLRKVTPPRGEHQSPIQALSDRELQVFELIGRGQSTKQIAGSLGVDTKTIETYRARIKDKLSLDSAPALMRAAFQWVNHGATPEPEA